MTPLRIAIAVEAEADRTVVTDLIDRVFVESGPSWVADHLDSLRTYVGLEADTPFTPLSRLSALAKAAGLRAHGHFDGKPGAAYALAGRKCILLAQMLPNEPIDALVIVPDSDGDLTRMEGLGQARDEARARDAPFPIVVACMHCKREAWAIAGFDPKSESEHSVLDSIRQNLGFDARLHSHELTVKADPSKPEAKRKAKDILERLTGGSWERQQACWRDTPLRVMEDRGKSNGLAGFLESVRSLLLPLLE